MLHGRQKEMRTHALTQAALVWSVGDLADGGIEAFIQYGEVHTKKETPAPYNPAVEAKIKEIQEAGGRLIVR